jgi:NADP-dependent 3-hydroxy acid dehydrogenase YdfG
MSKTIFITGASRGFGRIWTEAFLKRGDKVAATARDLNSLNDLATQYAETLLPIKLDVTDREGCFAAIKKAHEHFGTIDVVINNAGYGLFGTVEETSEQQARNLIETNVFGLLWVTKAAIPVMRKQGKGHIIQMSSLLGVNPLPLMGMYSASKFAMEALSETLAMEVKDFGINVTIVEPNGYATDFTNVSAVHAQPIKEYDQLKAAVFAGFTDDIFGVPESTVKAICKLIDTPQPPLRLFLGKIALPMVKQTYQNRLATWEEWQDVAVEAHGK